MLIACQAEPGETVVGSVEDAAVRITYAQIHSHLSHFHSKSRDVVSY
jgi:hypothetical protein